MVTALQYLGLLKFLTFKSRHGKQSFSVSLC